MRSNKRERWLLNTTWGDFSITFVIVSAFFLLADWRRQNPGPSNWLHHDLSGQIGAEYDTIAVAIRSGRGFSDPFREPSGPTAWMPPALVYFTAGLYWITGDNREAVIEIIVFINLMVLFYAGLLLVGTARTLGAAWIGCFVLIAALAADFFELYQRTHDTWLVLLMLCLIWTGIQYYERRGSGSWFTALGWGMLGGLCALCSPVVGFTWAVVSVLYWAPWSPLRPLDRPQGFHGGWRFLLVTALTSMVVVSPWMIRNRLVMGKWIPVKSNAMYEIWQSQVLDDDGVLDSSSAFQHPWGSRSVQRLRYLEVGELEFIAERREPVIDSIREYPIGLLQRVANRWFAATLYYQPLVAADEQMSGRMRLLRIYFPIPFLSLLLVLGFRRQSFDARLRIAVIIYCVYLLPYILISYYDRYAAPAFVFKAIILLYAIDTVWSWIRKAAGFDRHISSDLVMENPK